MGEEEELTWLRGIFCGVNHCINTAIHMYGITNFYVIALCLQRKSLLSKYIHRKKN